MPAHASLRRAFPPREYVRGRSLASALWGFAATLLLCGVLLALYLVADLLISRGVVYAAGTTSATCWSSPARRPATRTAPSTCRTTTG